MRIQLYYKLDRGYFESAYGSWRAQGGDLEQHLVATNPSISAWVEHFHALGHTCDVDVRSSFLLPPRRRRHLPLTITKLLRGALWVTQLDPWLLQRDIVNKFMSTRPDIVFVPLGSSIWPSTLAVLKSRGARLVQLCDVPARTMMARDRRNLRYFDLAFDVANLEAGMRREGFAGKCVYVPIGFSPARYRPLELDPATRQKFEADVCFIGGLSKQFHAQRRGWVEHALRNGINMKVWGGYREHFTDSPILNVWQGQIWGEAQVQALCSAKIGLNFHVDHEPGELDRGLNLRAFELAACGVFQLLQRVPSVGEFFREDEEIVCFDSREEMVDKIRFYLQNDNERARIAQNARARALRDHTWDQRVAQMSAAMQTLCTSP
jgi:glycosyltransferase involved in cell wall biosynthesis